MSKPNRWMPLDWGDYWRDTTHLNALEHGAYLNLIGAYWVSGKPLPDDDVRLRRMAHTTNAEWRKVGPTLRAFFTVRDGLLHHKRIDREIARAVEVHARYAEGARATNAKRRAQRNGEREKDAPPSDIPSPPQDSVPHGTAAAAPTDGGILFEGQPLKNRIFGPCLVWLAAQSKIPEARARAVTARWCAKFGDGPVLEAFAAAARQAPLDPVPYIEKVLHHAALDARHTRATTTAAGPATSGFAHGAGLPRAAREARASAVRTTSLDSALRLALETWKPYDDPPRLLSPENLNRLIGNLTASLTPAGDEAYARALTKLIEFAMAFGIPCGDPAAVQRIYREKLGDLPEDLLMRAVVRVTDGWTWGQRLPMPAEIRSQISQEFTYRRVQLGRARVALMKAMHLPPPRNIKAGSIPPEKWAALTSRFASKRKTNVDPETGEIESNQASQIDMGTAERATQRGGVYTGARVQTDAGLVRHKGATARVECVLDALRDTGLLDGAEGTRTDRTAIGRSRYDQGLWLRGLFLRAGLNSVHALDMSSKTGSAGSNASGGAGSGRELTDDAARARMKYNRIVRDLGPFAEAVTSFVCFDDIKRGEQYLSQLRKGLDRLCVMRG